jgi:transcriptional regulator with XRE-family HTH domain
MNKLDTFAQWMKAKRRECGLTQAQLAEQTGLGRTYVNAIENGRVKMPQLVTRQKIHEVLGSTDEELIDLELLAYDDYGNPYVPYKEPESEGGVTLDYTSGGWPPYIPRLDRVTSSPYGLLGAALIYAFSAMGDQQRGEILKLLGEIDQNIRESSLNDVPF